MLDCLYFIAVKYPKFRQLIHGRMTFSPHNLATTHQTLLIYLFIVLFNIANHPLIPWLSLSLLSLLRIFPLLHPLL